MTWEILKTKNTRQSQLPLVSFRETGTVSMTLAAFKMLGSPKFVALAVDRVSGRLGFFPCEQGTEGARAVYGKGNSHTISARTVVRDEKLVGRFRLIPFVAGDREPKPHPRAIIRLGEAE